MLTYVGEVGASQAYVPHAHVPEREQPCRFAFGRSVWATSAVNRCGRTTPGFDPVRKGGQCRLAVARPVCLLSGRQRSWQVVVGADSQLRASTCRRARCLRYERESIFPLSQSPLTRAFYGVVLTADRGCR